MEAGSWQESAQQKLGPQREGLSETEAIMEAQSTLEMQPKTTEKMKK